MQLDMLEKHLLSCGVEYRLVSKYTGHSKGRN